jgi:hypothetical protein
MMTDIVVQTFFSGSDLLKSVVLIRLMIFKGRMPVSEADIGFIDNFYNVLVKVD